MWISRNLHINIAGDIVHNEQATGFDIARPQELSTLSIFPKEEDNSPDRKAVLNKGHHIAHIVHGKLEKSNIRKYHFPFEILRNI